MSAGSTDLLRIINGFVNQRLHAITTILPAGSTDFFRIINDEAAIIERISSGELLYFSAVRSLAIMRGFVEALLTSMARPLSLEQFCAVTNNAVRAGNGCDSCFTLLPARSIWRCPQALLAVVCA